MGKKTRDKTAEEPRASEEPVTQSNELSQHLSGLTGMGDDFAVLVAENWQRLLTMLVVVLVAVYVVGEFRSSRQKKLEDSSVRLAGAQEMFAALVSPDKDKPEQPEAKSGEQAPAAGDKPADKPEDKAALLGQTVKLLAGDGSGSYREIAALYQAQVALREGKPDGVIDALRRYDTKRFSSLKQPLKTAELRADGLFDEMAALLVARAQIARGDKSEDVRMGLRGLVYGGSQTSIEALLTMARLAESDSEREEVRELGKSLSEARPELSDLLRSELALLGFALPS